MKRKTANLIISIAAAFALLWPQDAVSANKPAKEKEPHWHTRLSIAVKFAQRTGKPVLTFVHAVWDLKSWEAEQAVMRSEKFVELRRSFVLCRALIKSEKLGKSTTITSADLGGIIFFNKNSREIERIHWRGNPDEMLEVIARVAAGNSIPALRSRIKRVPSDTNSIELLYKVYSKRLDANNSLECLNKILAAAPDKAKQYEGHEDFWEVISVITHLKAPDAAELIEDGMKRVKDPHQLDLLRVRLFKYHSSSGQKEAVIAQLDKFTASDASPAAIEKAYELLLRLLIGKGDKNRTLMVSAKMIKQFPRNIYLLNILRTGAGECYAAGRFREAAAIFKLISEHSLATGYGIEAEFLYRAMLKGIRTKHRAAKKRAVLDVLYLVPDAPTLLAYVSRWDEKQFFPVLVDKNTKHNQRLIQKFITEFKPSKIIKVKESIKQELDEDFVRKAVLASFDDRYWSDVTEAGPGAFKKYYKKSGISPLGIVFVNTKSPGLLAGGVALAAGHRQLIDFYTNPAGPAKDTTREAAIKIRTDIIKKIASWGYEYSRPYDDINFLTLACPLPLRFKESDYHYYCIDDYIIRRDSDVRFAHCGRLLEGITSADYMAMCALFLQPGNAIFFNSYGAKKGGYAKYRTREAAAKMGKIISTVNVDGKLATLDMWKKIQKDVNTYRFVYINSAGAKDHWWVAGKKAVPADIPAESAPAIVHMTHSFSAEDPYDAKTVAGRWLHGGVYIYYGSTYEPFLESFKKPLEIVNSISENEPLGMAFRRGVGKPYWRKWRLCYFGDPVFVLTGKNPKRLPAQNIRLTENEVETQKTGQSLKD